MSLHSVAVATAAVLFATMAHAQAPSKFNSVWGVDDQNDVFRWNVSESKFVRMSGIALRQVSVGTGGQVWGIDPDGNVRHWNGFVWEPIEGQKLAQISANADEMWGVSATEALFRWNGSTWEALYDPEQKLKAIKQVSLGFDGSRWAIVRLMFASGIPEGYVWISPATPEWLDGDHEPAEFKLPLLPNEAVDSADGHPRRIWVVNAGQVWAISDMGLLFKWSSDAGGWSQPFDGSYLDVAEAENGELWRLTNDGGILFNQSPAKPTQTFPSDVRLKQIAVGSTGALDTALTIEERQQMLDAHNSERQRYPGVGPLQWAPELEQYAGEWAQAVTTGGKSGHRPDRQNNPFRPGEVVGENMYGENPIRVVTGKNAVDWFISEKQWYHHDQDNGSGPPGCTAPPGNSCGHFTQVIWKDTQYVGCGTAISVVKNEKVYVCNYFPPGNWNGKRPY